MQQRLTNNKLEIKLHTILEFHQCCLRETSFRGLFRLPIMHPIYGYTDILDLQNFCKGLYTNKQIQITDLFQMMMAIPEPMDTALDAAKGETWRRIRTVLSPSFSAHKLKAMTPLMNTACDTLLEKIKQVAESGESFDIVR